MVCPNCHSDRIIAVQDQHFCINCGQQVPEATFAKPSANAVPVGNDGLPEGVKILPLTPDPTTAALVARDAPLNLKAHSQPAPAPAAPSAPTATPIINHRVQLASAKPKKRKPGRPRAGRLDVPRIAPVASAVTATLAAPSSASTSPSPLPAPASPRLMSDIAPRRPARPARSISPAVSGDTPPAKSVRKSPHQAPPSHSHGQHHSPVHRLGVPPLHYGPVLAVSLRARVRQHWLILGSLAGLGLAAATGYTAWTFLKGGLPALAAALAHATPTIAGEAALLIVLYYIGRSLGQGAIIYGLIREADGRPVSLGHQLGVGINTFSRRLTLDLAIGLLELILIALGADLLLHGGGTWPLHPQVQIALIFVAFLAILYLLTGLALARGLAGVAITITAQSPLSAAKLGWRLFSHRLELVALRFVADALELLLAIPLAALALALVLTAPAPWHAPAAIAVGLVAWLAGALYGAGTAAWWAALYRRLVAADRPADANTLLTGYAAESPHAGALTLVVATSTFLISAALALPWLKFF